MLANSLLSFFIHFLMGSTSRLIFTYCSTAKTYSLRMLTCWEYLDKLPYISGCWVNFSNLSTLSSVILSFSSSLSLLRKFGSMTTFYTVPHSGFSLSKIIKENMMSSSLLSLVLRKVFMVDMALESRFCT